ncbi:hypothetical protein OQA88_9785 [Cercophora sp. LCS_1]
MKYDKTAAILGILGKMHPRRDELDGLYLTPAGNAFVLATFSALIPVSVFVGFRYKTPMYIAPMVAGLLVETTQEARILVAGLVLQVISLASFLVLYLAFRVKLSRRHHSLDTAFAPVFSSHHFNIWLLIMQTAAFLLLLRSVLRLAAFSGGMNGGLAGSRTVIAILDDVLVLLACIASLAIPVGKAFGVSWDNTSPFKSASDPEALPLRLSQGKLRRPQAFSISKPYPLTSVFAPMTHETAYERVETSPPLMSPRNKRVYSRAPYDILSVESKQTSYGFSPPSPGHLRKPPWPLSSGDPARDSARNSHRLVSADRIWN